MAHEKVGSGTAFDSLARAWTGGAANLPPEMVQKVLTALDDGLVDTLRRGDIRLGRSTWLLAQPADFKMPRRQELEALEMAGESPLFNPDEAVALIRKGDRRVATLTYGWCMGGDPDPDGARVKVVRRALEDCSFLEGYFWECASRGATSNRPHTSQASGMPLTDCTHWCSQLRLALPAPTRWQAYRE